MDNGDVAAAEDVDLRAFVIRALEDISLSLLRQLVDIIRNCHPDHHQSSDVPTGKMRLRVQMASRNGKSHTKEMWWPKRNPCARQLGALLRVVDLCHTALHDNTLLTKREIFYQDVALFGKQSRVDEIVDDLAATLGVNRFNLNVVCWAPVASHFKAILTASLNNRSHLPKA
ncbi:type IIB DNA topoisomerase-domain-containing protein [Cantharellus anzutake]|uniref:type IIB DNA topoisomerase-domain-containing protein n=1 Tax=Cantharellus anzutake TaxID=1750568 RepID=UPI001905008D|nr:type IIB DNA topoisomerase-domain-containing protein [Cantharellus anzutake]KAF8309967.1 type IIB DNA topoisomerase-domain-containing protein [Cantharellus anzutake]